MHQCGFVLITVIVVVIGLRVTDVQTHKDNGGWSSQQHPAGDDVALVRWLESGGKGKPPLHAELIARLKTARWGVKLDDAKVDVTAASTNPSDVDTRWSGPGVAPPPIPPSSAAPPLLIAAPIAAQPSPPAQAVPPAPNPSNAGVCRLEGWPPPLFAEPSDLPIWQTRQPEGCPIQHDAWSYHCTPAECMPKGKRVALLVGQGQHKSRLTQEQWEVLLSNSDIWSIGSALETMAGSPVHQAQLKARRPQYSYLICPGTKEQLPNNTGVIYVWAPTGSTFSGEYPVLPEDFHYTNHNPSSCKRASDECFELQVKQCKDALLPDDVCWEGWGQKYAKKIPQCYDQAHHMSKPVHSRIALLDYISHMKELNYDAVYVIGDVSDLPSHPVSPLIALANAVAITASLHGIRVVNLNQQRKADNWLRHTVMTLVEDRHLRCGSVNFEFPLLNPALHHPKMLESDSTRNQTYLRRTTIKWAVWDRVPDATTMNLPRTQRRVALIVGPGPSINDVTLEQWEIIRQHTEVWGLNEIFPHKFITPHFLHLEVENEDNEFWNAPELYGGQRDFLCRKDRFKNGTVLVVDQQRENIDNIPCLVAMPKRGYDRTSYANNGRCSCTPATAHYRPHGNQVSVPCCVTLNRVLSLFSRLGYDDVYMLGLDGSGGYFYTHEPYNINWNRDEREGRPSTEAKHLSQDSGLQHWIWAFGQYNGMRMVNLAGGGFLKSTIYTESVARFVETLTKGCERHVGPQAAYT